MKNLWWKILAFLLIAYSVVWGFLGEVPRLHILNETIRNLYFHVAMWMAMAIMLLISLINSLKFLNKGNLYYDLRARLYAETGMVFAILGLITGMVWAKFTWGDFWTNDPKLNGTAVAMLIYFAYFILRNSLDDPEKRGRLSGVYNIFAFVLMIVFLYILPKLADSMHPGSGGNVGFVQYDMDNRLRLVFYPAVLGWILFGVWVTGIRTRIDKLELVSEQNRIDNLYNEQ